MSYATKRPVATTLFAAPLTPRSWQLGYIERPADRELLRSLHGGESAYVLAARQTGKSRLLRRVQDELSNHGYRCVKLDMGALAFENNVAQWYLALAREIAIGLGQHPDFAEMILTRYEGQPPSQQFARLLQEVLLLSDAPLVIFLDEVDGLLSMPKAAAVEFLSALRVCVAACASMPLSRRLRFCMMGACTPAEITRGGQSTLLEIAREITLTDFDWDSVRANFLALFADRGRQSEAILARIYHWTQGHPYLTQEICAQLQFRVSSIFTLDAVDCLVREIFLGPTASEQEDFREIERRLLAGPAYRVMRRLAVYQRLLRGDKISARHHDPDHWALRLSGLATLVPGSPPFLAVRNPIFSSAFDASWILQTQRFKPILAAWHNGQTQLGVDSNRVEHNVPSPAGFITQ